MVFCLGLGFFLGGIKDLSGRICPGVRLIMALAAPEDDIFSGDGAYLVTWGQSEHLGVE